MQLTMGNADKYIELIHRVDGVMEQIGAIKGCEACDQVHIVDMSAEEIVVNVQITVKLTEE